MVLYEATHVGTPVPASRIRGTRNGFFHSKRYSQHRRSLCETFALAAGVGFAPIEQPCTVRIRISGARMCSDTDNHAKAVLDALQDSGVLFDDSLQIVCRIDVSLWADAPGPCTLVRIEEFDGVHPKPRIKRTKTEEANRERFLERKSPIARRNRKAA